MKKGSYIQKNGVTAYCWRDFMAKNFKRKKGSYI